MATSSMGTIIPSHELEKATSDLAGGMHLIVVALKKDDIDEKHLVLIEALKLLENVSETINRS